MGERRDAKTRLEGRVKLPDVESCAIHESVGEKDGDFEDLRRLHDEGYSWDIFMRSRRSYEVEYVRLL